MHFEMTQKRQLPPGSEDWLLKVIGCPQCKSTLTSDRQILHCLHCQSDYPIEAGIPSLLSQELRAALREGREAVKDFYLKERYDWTKDPRALEFVYHRYRRWTTWRHILNMLSPGSIVLDLGCGTGLITKQFIGRSQPVIALDLNHWALSRLDGKPAVVTIQGDGEALPIRDDSVDLVIATEMIEHLEDPRKTAAEVYRVCKKGGRVLGSVPSNSRFWKWRQHLSLTCGGGEPFHHNFTRTEIATLWQKAGFQVGTVQRSCLGLNWTWILEKP